MATAAARARTDGVRARAALRARLEARRDEIEDVALTRVKAISGPAEVSDPAYAEGLRAAISAAVAYGIETTGREGSDPPIPVALLAQARMAARVGIPLDTVLRRYFAGYSLLGYFVLEEAANAGLTDGDELKRLLGAHAGIFDRLLKAISEEHRRDLAANGRASIDRRYAVRIERLLEGEPIDTSDIAYDFEGWHVGIVALGPGVEGAVHAFAQSHDCHLLSLPREGEVLWAWLGTRRGPDALKLERLGSTPLPEDVCLAFGEPGEGLGGWRLTHRQAVAGLSVAQRSNESAVRYADVALIAAALRDETLATSLREMYLVPLERERDGGSIARETLRAYFAAGRHVTSAASALQVRRHTVTSRIRGIEGAIGRPISGCAAEIEAALKLEEIGYRQTVGVPGLR